MGTSAPIESQAAESQAAKSPSTAPQIGRPAPASRVALVGVHGFGTHHLRNLERLREAGVVELVAVADPHPPEQGSVPATAAVFPGLNELLARTSDLDVIIVATPIQTHAPLGLAALATTADLYLEKPPGRFAGGFQHPL